MTSKPFRITEIVKKTKAKGFDKFEVGDVLEFSMVMRNTSGAENGNYASYVTTVNLTKGTVTSKSQSITKVLLENSFKLSRVLDV